MTNIYIKKNPSIIQFIVNNVNLSVLKRYLHQNGLKLNQKFIGNQFRGLTQQKEAYPQQN